jgi:death on curing protein
LSEPKWITVAIATAIHDEAIYEFGGLPGIRDQGLLESALDRPRNLLAYESGTSIFRLAAALCLWIAKNHPFNDGNKRTALLTTRAFLFLNGQVFEPSQEEEVENLVAVAAGTMNAESLAAWLSGKSEIVRTLP